MTQLTVARIVARLTFATMLSAAISACTDDRKAAVMPAGAGTTPTTDALKAGAAAMQTHAPVNAMNVYQGVGACSRR